MREMNVSLRSEKVKLPKGKNEDERKPELEENRWRFMSFVAQKPSLATVLRTQTQRDSFLSHHDPNAESSSMTSQQYVKRNSPVAFKSIVTDHVSNTPARYQSPSTYSNTALATRPSPSHTESSTSIVCHSEDSLKAENRGQTQKEGTGQSRCQAIRIDVLPDDVLLGIFYFYVDMNLLYGGKEKTEAWQSLVHVCRRWRNLIFGSPRRLNLQLYCTPETPVKDRLHVWPALPLIVRGFMGSSSGTDNLIAALGQRNRIRQVILFRFGGWQAEEILAAMQVPFPELTDLQLFSTRGTPPVIPDSFLGGSAPRLRTLELGSILFPGLPKLLLSATHLVHLWLLNIPHSGYISPEVIVALLSTLSSLEFLSLEFRSPQSLPDWSLPPSKRSILPILRELTFKGVTEYLEELVARIDTPQLNRFSITFFNQIDFDCPRLAQSINCMPTLRALDEAHVQFGYVTASVGFRSRTSNSGPDDLVIEIPCREPDWQVSSIEQVCNNSSLHPLSTLEVLYIEPGYGQAWESDTIESTLWLELLRSFTAVKDLYLSKALAPTIVAALQELVGARITEVLPSLQNIFVAGLKPSGPFRENIGQFVAARQLSDHPIAISVWDEGFDTDTDSDINDDNDNDKDSDMESM